MDKAKDKRIEHGKELKASGWYLDATAMFICHVNCVSCPVYRYLSEEGLAHCVGQCQEKGLAVTANNLKKSALNVSSQPSLMLMPFLTLITTL